MKIERWHKKESSPSVTLRSLLIRCLPFLAEKDQKLAPQGLRQLILSAGSHQICSGSSLSSERICFSFSPAVPIKMLLPANFSSPPPPPAFFCAAFSVPDGRRDVREESLSLFRHLKRARSSGRMEGCVMECGTLARAARV